MKVGCFIRWIREVLLPALGDIRLVSVRSQSPGCVLVWGPRVWYLTLTNQFQSAGSLAQSLHRSLIRSSVCGCAARCDQLLLNCPQGSVIDPILKTYQQTAFPMQMTSNSSPPHNHHDTLQNSSTSWSKDWELDLNPTKSNHLPPLRHLHPSVP